MSVPAQLSRRRREVLSLAANGLTDKEIAAVLEIRLCTVRFHFAACCRALRARTRLHATALALTAGLIALSQSGDDDRAPGPYTELVTHAEDAALR